jgi:predicted transcriptional regulator
MAKAAIFTMKLEPELRAEFMAAAAAVDRPASQILRELMREFITERAMSDDYRKFLAAKVARGWQDYLDGNYRSNEEVEADFAALRAGIKA